MQSISGDDVYPAYEAVYSCRPLIVADHEATFLVSGAGDVIAPDDGIVAVGSGKGGTGKTTVARLFARAVNCQRRAKDSAEPCNTCPTCVAQLTNASLDVVEVTVRFDDREAGAE